MAKVNINDIIDINGSVIGFFFIYFLPALLHFKCMYFPKGKRPIPPKLETTEEEEDTEDGNKQKAGQTEGQHPQIQLPDIDNNRKVPLMSNLSTPKSDNNGQDSPVRKPGEGQLLLSEEEVMNSYYLCDEDNNKLPKWQKVMEIIMMLIMVGLGVFIMINGIQTVVTS